jgi:hypothetical protein
VCCALKQPVHPTPVQGGSTSVLMGEALLNSLRSRTRQDGGANSSPAQESAIRRNETARPLHVAGNITRASHPIVPPAGSGLRVHAYHPSPLHGVGNRNPTRNGNVNHARGFVGSPRASAAVLKIPAVGAFRLRIRKSTLTRTFPSRPTKDAPLERLANTRSVALALVAPRFGRLKAKTRPDNNTLTVGCIAYPPHMAQGTRCCGSPRSVERQRSATGLVTSLLRSLQKSHRTRWCIQVQCAPSLSMSR